MNNTARITVTPLCKLDYDAVKQLAKTNNTTLSQIVSVALHEWLKHNYKKGKEFCKEVTK
tara:strand:+ start:6534 stop:6713 length:180 start_codon:yes stop_codon:yes gene_type:complete